MSDYALLARQLETLLDTRDWLTNTAQTCAFLMHEIPDLNWAGFYLYKDEQLVLGPFQGLPACIRIPMGKGVCGTAAQTNSIQRIDDVHAFPGHIACDAASESEIVIPLVVNGDLLGVLDIDSPKLSRFSADDEAGLAAIVDALVAELS